MEKLKVFVLKKWKYIVTALVALFIGTMSGADAGELEAANEQVAELQQKLEKTEGLLSSAEDQNKELQEKVDEAAPFFAMSEAEKKQAELDAAAKEEELRKQEEEAKKKEEAEKLAARTKTLTAGTYIVGEDIEAGKYNCKAVSGNGNFFVNSGLKLNEMFGVDTTFYNNSYNNLTLETGDTIELNSNLQIKFTPVN